MNEENKGKEIRFDQLYAVITDQDLYYYDYEECIDYKSTEIAVQNVIDILNKSGFKILKTHEPIVEPDPIVEHRSYIIPSIQSGINSIDIATGEQHSTNNLVEELLEYFPTFGLTNSCNKFKLPKDVIMQIIKAEYPHMFQPCGCREGKPMFCMQACCDEYGMKFEYSKLLL